MTSSVGRNDVERFREVAARIFGLQFDDSKSEFLAEVLARRAHASSRAVSHYLVWLEQQSPRLEIRALASELTVGETYFFRNIEQFRALAEVVLPDRLAVRTGTRRLRFLSAGCASGEEPYSLALLLGEQAVDHGSNSIRAVDVNPAMLERAGRGRYSSWALRETPRNIQQRWFTPQGRDFVLSESIRSGVAFSEHNLAEDDPELWAPESYDIVFCRNVIMYFTPDVAASVVNRITRALAPGGYLFLGHAETLRGISANYHLRHTHGTFYYQRRDELSVSSRETPAVLTPSLSPPLPDLSQDVSWANSWVEVVQRASDRIRTLAERPAGSSDWNSPHPSTALRSAIDLGIALELLKKERFAEALELLDDLPAESARDTDVLLLRAALLAHSGQLDSAQQACEGLLRIDELNTGAHYVMALCREALGDRESASDHDQMAAYLDPGFAMPRLHLGLMAKRTGNRDVARRELAEALQLLQREDSTRLLLFGGGFGREALMALCRAELLASGGRP